jgi:phospholipid/cholesterol/gamma-HCH transport system substrate-binding protein
VLAVKSFQERDPIPIAITGLLVIALVVAAGYHAESLPIIGGGTSYTAEFSEAAGLQEDDPVHIAGVEAGRVSGIELAGDRVLVTMRIPDAWLGDQTTASIEIRTLLGAKSVRLDPRGERALDPGTPIPLARTAAPYDVVEALNDLSGTLRQTDIAQLEQSLRVLADTFRGTPDEIRGTVDGLSRLSRAIAGRDREIRHLLTGTHRVAGVLADRNAEFERLLADGNLLLGEVVRRREAISALLTSVQALSTQLRGLVAENGRQLRPALEQLDQVAAVLQRNQDNLDRSLELAPVFLRLFTNALGNGRWFDSYACGLLPPPAALGPLTVNPEGC